MDIRLLILETTRLEELKEFYSYVLDWPPADEEEGSFTLELQKTELEFRQHNGVDEHRSLTCFENGPVLF